MCGCSGMESYEEFCLQSLASLQEEGKLKRKTCEPLCSLQAAHSVIYFHGKAILSPLLSAEQRSEMCRYRRRAILLDLDRQNKQRDKLQNLSDQLQPVQGVPPSSEVKLPVSKSATVIGYTLVNDSPGITKDPGSRPKAVVEQPVTPPLEIPIFNGCKVDVKIQKQQRSEEDEDEEEDDEDISLDSLLKRSREFVKQKQSQQGSKVALSVSQTPPSEAASVKEQLSCSPMRDTGVEFGFSLHHSPVGPPPIQHQSFYDPNPHKSVALASSKQERYARLPSPESCVSPRPCRRKQRPVSTGNIHMTFPIGPADLVPQSPGKPGEGASMADWEESSSMSTGLWSFEKRDNASRSGNQRSSHCIASPVQENGGPVSASVPSCMIHHDHQTVGFRRRCHTLDSQLNTYQSEAEPVDRSQERVPRFMAGVMWLGPNRHTPATPLNQSYKVENPSPTLLRSLMTPDESHGSNNGRKTPTVLRKTAEAQSSVEEAQWRTQALEDIQRRLEEEHTMQMSLLLAEHEKEQQRLRLELEERERELKEQESVRPVSGDSCVWTYRSVSGSCPVMSPSCPRLSPIHTPSEQSAGHTLGFPSSSPSSIISPSIQPAVCLWGSSWTANKPRARLSLVLTTKLQGAFCQIGAIIRGFLIRRLLKTEKIKQLRQTVLDTQEFIRSFETEAAQKRGAYSAQDLSLQERVRAQLRAALYDVHDIFFEMSLRDRLAVLQQDRELRAERKLRDLEKAKSAKERASLSAATQRSLDRKKR
ncbi:centriolar coiled-coil protein of 110 kDa-like [Nematolebias whitei]|uniref:centriolar coiled-coil protein of 110 kDa-like n=1 Tax=Nematolebias whitei TaxID=451745 RepID=UPI001896EDA3|nr:centriolar coiled-coil protein of 110 kDa-like [Nematolebias whitei]